MKIHSLAGAHGLGVILWLLGQGSRQCAAW